MDNILIMNIIILWVMVLLNLILTFAVMRKIRFYFSKEITFETLKNGEPAPEFQINGSDGNNFSLNTFKGRKLLILFVSHTCKHCGELMSEINNLLPKFKTIGLEIFAINGGDITATKQFIEDNKVKFQMLSIPVEDNPIWKNYLVQGVPHYCIIDGKGIVLFNGKLDGEWNKIVNKWKEPISGPLTV